MVDAVGEGVSEFQVGERVATASGSGYAEYALAPAARTVLVPESLSLEQAAAVMLQGLTAHYLAYSTYPLKRVKPPWCTPPPAERGSCWCKWPKTWRAGHRHRLERQRQPAWRARRRRRSGHYVFQRRF